MLYVINAQIQVVQPENPIKKTVLKSPMQLIISLQISNYNIEKTNTAKIKQK